MNHPNGEFAGTVVAEVCDGIGCITLANPQARNALDDATRQSLLAALQALADDSDVAAIVLTGGDEVFCAGGDLRSMPTEPQRVTRRLGEMQDIARVLLAGPKPVVAAVNGAAFGSGFSLVAASDVVIAGPTASFGCTFNKVGLIADTGLNYSLGLKIGAAAGRRILLGARVVSAEQAHAIGLVDEIAPVAEVRSRAFAVAAKWCGTAPLAVAATRRLLAPDLERALAAEMRSQMALLGSEDFAEGREAFFGRRAPAFRGQ